MFCPHSAERNTFPQRAHPTDTPSPVLISRIKPEGPAAHETRLKVGCQVLAVGTWPCDEASHEEVVAALKVVRRASVRPSSLQSPLPGPTACPSAWVSQMMCALSLFLSM